MELLCPGGDLNKALTALAYGADAVYVSSGPHSLRAHARGIDAADLPGLVRTAHGAGKKVYFCLNLFARERHLDGVRKGIDLARSSGVDGLIAADPGVVRLALRLAPEVPLHVSTQANTANAESMAFWKEMGATRINAARELERDELATMLAAPNRPEVEVFVHGALCLAVSGQCFLSQAVNRRSANTGECTQPCRYDYRDMERVLEEKTRPGGGLWRTRTGEEFSTVLAMDDLCLLPVLKWLARRGTNAVKIEGRMRSVGYAAMTADVYRTALDDAASGRFRLDAYAFELSAVSVRSLSTGFFLGRRKVVVVDPAQYFPPPRIVAQIKERIGPDAWQVAVKSRWQGNETVCVVAPKLFRPMLEEYRLEKPTGETVREAHSGMDLILRSNSVHPAPFHLLRSVPQGVQAAKGAVSPEPG